MKQTTYNLFTGVVFVVVGAVHAVRAFNGWGVMINNFALPVWASWISAVILFALAYHAFKLRNK